MVKKMVPVTVSLVLLLISTSFAESEGEGDWTKYCNRCKCVWMNGKKTANCTSKDLNAIPTDLSQEIREFDFSQNALYLLNANVFLKAGLRDTHKLKLQNCNLDSIDKTAFGGLSLLIELDLSRNTLKIIERNTFRDNFKLRVLNLSFNKLKKVEDSLFSNLTFLQKILLNNNEIEAIANGVFTELPLLQNIDLSSNKLTRIDYDFRMNFGKLRSIDLADNPWICDCHLSKLRENGKLNNLLTTETTCDQPERLRGKSWNSPIVFACLPQVLELAIPNPFEVTTSNVTLPCKVTGDPHPNVEWFSNGRSIDIPRQRYTISTMIGTNYTWNNLTIFNVNARDRGEYKCRATNAAGSDEKYGILLVNTPYVAGGSGSFSRPIGTSMPIIIGVCVAVIFMLLIIVILLFRCLKKRPHHGAPGKGGENESSSEYINLHDKPEIGKALITDVNPLAKPPRFSMAPPAVGGGTEVSDMKRTLLDSDSTINGDDIYRSQEYVDMLPKRNSDMLNIDYPEYHTLPPDLIAFPHRASQVSPAGSAASTVVDTSRLPAIHGPQSPTYSPDFQYVYRTLPHSRSHSPFVVVPAMVPRQGYVTIPRRPRQQSWSSEPPEIEEPLYDNLGLRTTVTGNSWQSLNKLDASTPKSNRMFPLSPSSCDPIAEHESPPTNASTLPRIIHAQKLSPSRTNWARTNAEALLTPERRNSISTLPSPEKKVTKIPPRPPPKPRNKLSTNPLFEDEGEDGTEV